MFYVYLLLEEWNKNKGMRMSQVTIQPNQAFYLLIDTEMDCIPPTSAQAIGLLC